MHGELHLLFYTSMAINWSELIDYTWLNFDAMTKHCIREFLEKENTKEETNEKHATEEDSGQRNRKET